MRDILLNVHVVMFSLREDALHVLLTPAEGATWQLPNAQVQSHESLENAAARAFAGQIDKRQAHLEQLYTYGDPDRDPRWRLVSVVYFALVPTNARQASGKMRWFRVDHLPPLAYDHTHITAYALRRLRYKLEYSAVGFQLLPSEFTLSELQHTYEIILGEKLDKRNFRRRILGSGIIEETLHHRRSGEGRPARLYRYRPDAVAEVKARRLFP
ncbi:MAG: NUDIX domain-containing protein [Chloroflexi bacterium]|nr:NUDIX domain-containing protein [Chloroflexota bacterium]